MERTKKIISETPVGRTSLRFEYDGTSLTALGGSISAERLRTYLELASGNHSIAMRMYTRNVALGSAFYGPLQTLEVALRNAVNNSLADRHGDFWFNDAALLKHSEFERAKHATQRVRKQLTAGRRKQLTVGRIVAELNFGFWVALFAKGYEARLWRTNLHRLFAPQPKRHELHGQLDRLRTLRNRVAHHEPILQRDLQTDYDKIIWILQMLSPTTAAWTKHHSRVPEILRVNHLQVARF